VEQKPHPRAQQLLDGAREMDSKFARIAAECEASGHWDRAAQYFQNRLVLEFNAGAAGIPVWFDFARFCMRVGGRQAAAEEALKAALELGPTGEMLKKVTLMLASVLLDRGRCKDAIYYTRSLWNHDRTDEIVNFLLAMQHFAFKQYKMSRRFLYLSHRPKDFFTGCPDEAAIFNKVKLYCNEDSDDDEPAAKNAPGVTRTTLQRPKRLLSPHVENSAALDVLDMLVEWGLPDLVLLVYADMGCLHKDTLSSERLCLILARAWMLRRDYVPAVSQLEHISALSGSNVADILCAESCFQLEDYDRSAEKIEKVLQEGLDQVDFVPFTRLGAIHLLRRRWMQARERFLEAIRLNPSSTDAWFGVAVAALREQELGEAHEAVREASILDDHRPDVWAISTIVHVKLENAELASKSFTHMLQHNLTNYDLLIEAGQCFLRPTGIPSQPKMAHAAAQRALDLGCMTGEAHVLMAEALVLMDKANAAVLQLQLAIGLISDTVRRSVVEHRALEICKELNDPPLAEAVHLAMKKAEQQDAEMSRSIG